MVAVVAGSVAREHFIAVLKAHGCAVIATSDKIQAERDEDHFAQVWFIPEDQTFLMRAFVEQVARSLNIELEEFTRRDDEQQGRERIADAE